MILFGTLTRGLGNLFRHGRRAKWRYRGKSRATAEKAIASEAARFSAFEKGDQSEKSFEDQVAKKEANFFFRSWYRKLPTPVLTEAATAGLSADDAEQAARMSQRFYGNPFPLFPGSGYFYEEVEEEYLDFALGRDLDSEDTRFLNVLDAYRANLNANTRMLFVWHAPFIFFLGMFLAVLAYAFGFLSVEFSRIFPESDEFLLGLGAGDALRLSSFLAVGSFLVYCTIMVLYNWAFKNIQRENIDKLNNYVTAKFAHINQNFQVAKRRALNVEREGRMAQKDDMKFEAGAWTIAYHWYAMRLYLCELAIRNRFYQMSRNAELYNGAGMGANIVWQAMIWLIILVAVPMIGLEYSLAVNLIIVVFALLLAVAVWKKLRQARGMILSLIENNQWSRFNQVNLRLTIAEHVGEDKLQIVTFRDRNRME